MHLQSTGRSVGERSGLEIRLYYLDYGVRMISICVFYYYYIVEFLVRKISTTFLLLLLPVLLGPGIK